MPSYPNRFIKGKPDATATGVSLIDMKNLRLYSSVTLYAGGFRYSGPGEAVHGSLYGISYQNLQIAAQGQDIKFRSSGNSPITLNAKIVGADRVVASGGTPQNGYVKAFTSAAGAATETAIDTAINALAKARGLVVSGGSANTDETEATADVLVAMSYGLIV